MSNKQKLLDELKQLDNRSREILLELDKEYVNVIELKDKLQSMGFVFENFIYKMNNKYGQITLSHDFHTLCVYDDKNDKKIYRTFWDTGECLKCINNFDLQIYEITANLHKLYYSFSKIPDSDIIDRVLFDQDLSDDLYDVKVEKLDDI